MRENVQEENYKVERKRRNEMEEGYKAGKAAEEDYETERGGVKRGMGREEC